MLKQSRPTRARRVAGLVLVALLGLGSAYAAWATQAPQKPHPGDASAAATQWAVHLEFTDGAGVTWGPSDAQMIVREGEPSEFRYGKDGDHRRVVMTVTAAGSGMADLQFELYRRDKLESKPKLRVREGEPAQIKVGSDNGTASAFDGFDLHVTVERASPSVSTASKAIANRGDSPAAGNANSEAVYRAMKSPVYPPEAIKQRIQGTLYVKVKIGTDGKVLDAKLDHANPDSAAAALGDSAVTAVKSWTFEPAQSNGVKIESESVVPIEYAIHEDDKPEDAAPQPGTLDKIKVLADPKG